MLARLLVHTPFHLCIPDGVQFDSIAYELDGCVVLEKPPMRSDLQSPLEPPPDLLKLNGHPAYDATVLVIDFHKDEFDRQKGPEAGLLRDPSPATLQKAVNNLIRRLRYVTRGANITPIELTSRHTIVQYLTDDGAELEKNEALFRKQGIAPVKLAFGFCTPEVWKDVQALGPNFEAPIWSELLLDAEGALPHVGSAIALAATALERFINETLNDLAARMVQPPPLWAWLVNQPDPDKLPSVADMFDELLKVFTGHSLKEDAASWEAMQNVKNARNNFVHGGVARIGKVAPELTVNETRVLLQKANAVVTRVREWLPTPAPWPPYSYGQMQLEARVKFGLVSTAAPGTPAEPGTGPIPE